MSFNLKSVVPWGRSLSEYKRMFALAENELKLNILSVADGPASFNAELTLQNGRVTSLDPIYQFSKEDIIRRIDETKDEIIEQTIKNRDNFVWKEIKNVEDLVSTRMNAMNKFIDDYEKGKKEGRYIFHLMPERTIYKDQCFDLGLSSHFLLLYDNLGIEFHIAAITEMLRICREVRIFPILNLNAQQNLVLDATLEHFAKYNNVSLVKVAYEFQQGCNQMLQIRV